MRALIQRVKQASVIVDDNLVATIGKGFLIFAGIGKDDKEEDIKYICRKVSGLRIFNDGKGRMNLDIKQSGGEILSVSQFTLYADTRKGNRPGFDRSARPVIAEKLWRDFNEQLRRNGIIVREGVFGAHMHVKLINDGPVTIWMDSRNR